MRFPQQSRRNIWLHCKDSHDKIMLYTVCIAHDLKLRKQEGVTYQSCDTLLLYVSIVCEYIIFGYRRQDRH